MHLPHAFCNLGLTEVVSSQVPMLENLPQRHFSPPGSDGFSPESDGDSLRQELQHEQTKLKLVLDLTNSVLSNLDLKELIRNISPSIRRVMQLDAVGLSLPSADGKHLEVCALDFPNGSGHVQPGELLPLDSRPGQVLLTGKPWVGDTSDITTYPGSRRAVHEGLMTHCSLPLTRCGRALGVLSVARLQGNSFAPDEVEFLIQIAGQIAIAIDNALAYQKISELTQKLEQEKLYLEDEIRDELNFEEIVGNSGVLRQVLQQVEAVAPTDSTVLIQGETGSGKELIARAVHKLSNRSGQPFVKLNCAAIPTGLLESELFGHEKGAFTGAIAQRIGRFELASEGTIFLDEVAEIPLELQPKLLRVLQEREFERLGSSRTLYTRARLIAATNRDLNTMVETQKFRSDLFYRLSVFPIYVPPLRERTEDIPFLVSHFAQHFARLMKKSIDTISSETMNALIRYPWPGNIRELQNVIERALILSKSHDLKVPLTDLQARLPENGNMEGVKKNGTPTLEEVERKHILSVLEQTRWVLSGPNGAAKKLGLKRSTLQFRIRRLGITRPSIQQIQPSS
jgi:formate hydrogenlyase transcriptional activator